jgi:hypothetical protein
MRNDSASRYSSSISRFLSNAITDDLYVGLGVDGVGYASKDTRLAQRAANVSSFVKRVGISDIFAAFEKNDWAEGKSFKVYDPTDPDIKSSTCYNSTSGELFICIENNTNNLFTDRNSNNPSKFAPYGSNGTIIELDDGYKWLKVNYNDTPISANYVKIVGIEALSNFKGITADNQLPVDAVTTIYGSSGLTYGTCCLYYKQDFVEPMTGKTYAKGDIYGAFKVANAWACEHLGALTDLHPVFKNSLTTTELGGFFNIASTSGCTPCGATYADVTPKLSYSSGGSAGYSSTNIYKKNYDILTSLNSGCILNAVLNIDSSISYYVSAERPELTLVTDGNIGSCKAYLTTTYIGSNKGWKVTGVELEGQLSSSDITYVEAINLTSATGSASSGDFSVCLASLQFNLAPITSTKENYLSVYDLLRTESIAVNATITTAKIQTTIPSAGSTYNFDSAFLLSGVKNSSGYRIAPKIFRDSKDTTKSSSTVSISISSGSSSDLTQDSLVFATNPSSISDNYYANKALFDKDIGSGDTAFVNGKATSSYSIAFKNFTGSTGTAEISYFESYGITSGTTLYFENTNTNSGTFNITGITSAAINIQDCDVLFATDTTFNQDKSNLTLIFTI